MKLLAALCLLLFVLSTANAQPQHIQWSKSDPRCDEIYSEGQLIRTIRANGLFISVIGGHYDNYFVADVFVGNDSDRRVNVLPEKTFFVMWKKAGDKQPSVLNSISPEKVAARAKNKSEWGSFFRSLAAGMASTTTRSTANTSGTVSVTGSGGMATGIYTEDTTTTTTGPNDAAPRRAAERNAEARENAKAKGDLFRAYALDATTLFPSQQIRGAVYFDKKSFNVSLFAIEIDGVSYNFAFGPPAR
jgi:hypothetical protein